MKKQTSQISMIRDIISKEGWMRVSIDRMYADTPKPDGWFMSDVFLPDTPGRGIIKAEGVIPPSQKELRCYFKRNSEMLFRFGGVERYDAEHVTAIHACPFPNEIRAMLLKCAGVGPSTADKVIAAFGRYALFVVDEHPELLDQVVSEKCKQSILVTLASLSNRDRFRAKVPKNILPEWKLDTLYRYLGEAILDAFADHPYEILTEDMEEDGISFPDIDKVTCFLYPDYQSDEKMVLLRLQYAVRYFVKDTVKRNGDTCIMVEGMEGSPSFDAGMHDLAGQFNAFYAGLNMPLMSGSIFYSWCSYEKTALSFVPDPDHIYTCLYDRHMLSLEKGVSSFFRRLSYQACDASLSSSAVSAGILKYESRYGLSLAPEQREAIKNSLSSRLSVITGIPGSGKTTSASCILAIWNRLTGGQVFLMAPTGLAVKRLTDAVSHVDAFPLAGTIDHYLTKAMVARMQGEDPSSWFEGRLMVIDETSMLDLGKMYRLSGLLYKSHVVFLGDVDQLPSIGIGTVFSDLIQSGICPVSRLAINHRSGECKALAVAASLIRDKACPGPEWGSVLDGSLDWSFFGKDAYFEDMGEFWKWYGPVFKNTGDLREIAVLSPTKDVVKKASFFLQDALNPERTTAPFDQEGGFRIYDTEGMPIQKCFCYQGDPSRRLMRVGDRAMFRKNIPDYGLVNGDMGFIRSYTEDTSDKEDHKLYFVTDDGIEAEIMCGDFKYLEPGYAVSVHKPQGCEYKYVFLLLKNLTWDADGRFANRNLVYTAVTRAKKQCMVFGHTESFWHCIRQDMRPRCGMLVKRLQGHIV